MGQIRLVFRILVEVYEVFYTSLLQKTSLISLSTKFWKTKKLKKQSQGQGLFNSPVSGLIVVIISYAKCFSFFGVTTTTTTCDISIYIYFSSSVCLSVTKNPKNSKKSFKKMSYSKSKSFKIQKCPNHKKSNNNSKKVHKKSKKV